MYIYEKSGKKRKAIEKNCEHCDSLFLVQERFVKKGEGKFCSKECFFISRRNRVEVNCAWCSCSFEKKESSLKNSKSGLYFCSRNCKDEAQSLDGIIEIHPSHFGDGQGRHTYRTKAFKYLPNKCAECGYEKYKEVLDVHHKDGNKNNNKIENLEILCPTHHVEKHFLTESGRFSKKVRGVGETEITRPLQG